MKAILQFNLGSYWEDVTELHEPDPAESDALMWLVDASDADVRVIFQ